MGMIERDCCTKNLKRKYARKEHYVNYKNGWPGNVLFIMKIEENILLADVERKHIQ